MLIRREVIEQVGRLDERYFLVVEDIDYCHRVGKSGWRLAVRNDAVIWHKVSRSMGLDSALQRYYYTRNRLFFVFKKTRGVGHKVAFAIFFAASRLINFCMWAFTGKGHRIRPSIQGILDFFRGRMGCQVEPSSQTLPGRNQLFPGQGHARN